MNIPGGAVFADLVRAIRPYVSDVVFVGGWVHALYLIEDEGDGTHVLYTSDIDITLPRQLDTAGRQPLVEVVKQAGFEIRRFDGEGLLEIFCGTVDLDLLAEAPNPQEPVRIDGQPDLSVFGYPHQDMLRQNTRWIGVGAAVDASLEEPVQILVPTLAAYALGKVLSSSKRSARAKQVKDLVYLTELLYRDSLRERIYADMPALLGDYSSESKAAESYLHDVVTDAALVKDIAEQSVEASGFDIQDHTSVRAKAVAHFGRFIEEVWG